MDGLLILLEIHSLVKLRPHTYTLPEPLSHHHPCKTYRHILGPKEELTVEVGIFNGVHVCHSDVPALTSSQANHCKVLQEFTANGTRSHLRKWQSRLIQDILEAALSLVDLNISWGRVGDKGTHEMLPSNVAVSGTRFFLHMSLLD